MTPVDVVLSGYRIPADTDIVVSSIRDVVLY